MGFYFVQEVFIEVSKAVFAICDSESMYIYNLMEYVHSRKGEEFEVQAFTGVESLCACAKEKTIEILLISGKLLCEQVRELQIRKVMVLSEGEQICELSEYSAVYKYQPADSLIAEVMDSYARVKEAPAAALFKPEVEVTFSSIQFSAPLNAVYASPTLMMTLISSGMPFLTSSKEMNSTSKGIPLKHSSTPSAE